MSNESAHWAAQAAKYTMEMKRSLASLVGIAIGFLGDHHLSDDEIHFLRDWLTTNDAIAYAWPGDVILARVKAVLEDGIVTDAERAHLVATLQDLCGSTIDDMAACARTTGLAFDQVTEIVIPGHAFCLTGDFVYAPREICERAIQCRGGLIKTGVSKKVHYLVVGARGSEAWKHGSFGTKIARAMTLKEEGVPLLVVDEQTWTAGIDRCPATI